MSNDKEDPRDESPEAAEVTTDEGAEPGDARDPAADEARAGDEEDEAARAARFEKEAGELRDPWTCHGPFLQA
jgi:hypothetical protein